MEPFTLGRALGSTLRVWGRNLPAFLLLTTLVYLPFGGLLAAIHAGAIELDTGSMAVGGGIFLLTIVLDFVLTSTLVYGVVSQLRGQPIALRRCLSVGLGRLLPVLGVSLVTGLCVILGFAAFIIPGLIIYCMLFVAVPVAVLERPGVFASLSRSRALTADHRGTIFAMLLLGWFVSFVVDAVLVVTLDPDDLGTSAYVFASFVHTVVFASLGAVLQAVVYHDLRNAKEGAVAEDLARVFD